MLAERDFQHAEQADHGIEGVVSASRRFLPFPQRGKIWDIKNVHTASPSGLLGVAKVNRPNDEQLKGMALHILYEIDEFRRGFERWASLRPEDVSFNPTIEASLLHYRILRDFLITPAAKVTRDDDVVAAYYVRGEWPPAIPDTVADEALQAEVHKRIAHLSTARLKPRTAWPTSDMANGIEKLIAEFRQQLRADLVAPFVGLTSGTFVGRTAGTCSTTTTTSRLSILTGEDIHGFFRLDD